nr:MAG TPA: hypothetical protein [Caudoviricetes sp.]
MSEVVNLAVAVAGFLTEYNAEVLYFPTFDLRDLDDLRVVVVPNSTEYKTVSRERHEEILKVQIGFLKRGSEENLDDLLRIVEKIGLGFLNRKLGGATCVCVAYNPIYSPEHLRERGQFTSIIELTFRKICS